MAKRTRWILTISGGILAALPWWGANWVFLLVCFVPLLLVEADLENYGEGSLSILPFSFVFFLIWNIIVTWWMARIHLAGGTSVIILNATIMSLVFFVYSTIKQNSDGGVAIFLVLWTAFEFLHHRGDLSWPWLSLGNGLAGDIRIIQWYEYTGMPGGTVWILLSNIMIYVVICKYQKRRPCRALNVKLALLTVVLIFPPVFSIHIFNSYEADNETASFLVLQPVVDPYKDKFSGMSNSQRLDQLINMAERNMESGVDYIVTPETAVDSIWITDPDDVLLNRVKKFSAKYPGTGVLLGATSFASLPTSESSFTTREDEDGNFFEVHNSALYFFSGRYSGVYHKHYLANGVEQIPFQRHMGFLEGLSVEMGGVAGTMLPGEGPEVFRPPGTDHPVIGTIICFESSYGEYSAAMAEKGAEIIVVISNDGWFKNTGAYRQHLRLSRIRAVETRRDIVRAANTGISCHISRRGEIIKKAGWWEEDSILVHPSLNNANTFYTGSGDYFGRVALFFSLLMVLDFIIKRIIQRKQKTSRINRLP